MTTTSTHRRTRFLASDPVPLCFWGGENDYKHFSRAPGGGDATAVWVFRDESGGEIGTIENVWYEPDDVYRSTDGYGGAAYKMSIKVSSSFLRNAGGEEKVVSFRHMKDVFRVLGAFDLCKREL